MEPAKGVRQASTDEAEKQRSRERTVGRSSRVDDDVKG